MKSYLIVWFNSEGGRPSEITQRLMSMGFKPVQGEYDYVYDWSDSVNTDEILQIGDKVQHTLKGLNVMFKIESIWLQASYNIHILVMRRGVYFQIIADKHLNPIQF